MDATQRRLLEQVRSQTTAAHRRLEERLDVVARLAEPASRSDLIRRYAALHVPADDALAPELGAVADLSFAERSRAPWLARFLEETAPDFPRPANRAEGLGLFYVLEGSTLGGRIILRDLSSRGVTDPDLAFLDPYGDDTGSRWRSFLSVFAREVGDGQGSIADACRGAVRGFSHAERVLCGDAA